MTTETTARNGLNLYDLPEDFDALLAFDTEAPAEAREVTFAMLEALGELETRRKIEYLAKVVKQMDAEADLLDSHIAAVEVKRDARRRRIENIKAWMHSSMLGYGIDKVQSPLGTVRLQRNSQPAVDVTDEAAVPWKYRTLTASLPFGRAMEILNDAEIAAAQGHVKKQAIIEDFKASGEVPEGVEIDATRQHVRVS